MIATGNNLFSPSFPPTYIHLAFSFSYDASPCLAPKLQRAEKDVKPAATLGSGLLDEGVIYMPLAVCLLFLTK